MMTPLAELCSSVDYGYTASASQDPAVGPKFLRITDIVPDLIDWSAVPHCAIDASKRDRFLLDAGDIVVARTGATVGYAKQIWARPEGATFASYLVRFRPDPTKADPFYIGQVVQSASFKKWVKSVAGGAAQPNANATLLGTFEVPLPARELQRKIGSALRAIAGLIENNRRRIEILEEMARLIYREWFVHFRFPGHEDVELVDSDVGPIPEGWHQGPIESVLSFHIGGGWGQEQPSEDEASPAAVIRGTDIPRARNLALSSVPKRHHKLSTMKHRLLKPGDLVMEVSGGSKGQPVGRTLIVTERLLSELGGDAICASFCKLLRFDDHLAPEIGYFALRDLYDSGLIDRFQVQSTGITNLKFKAFLEQFHVRVPSQHVQDAFLGLVRPLIRLSQTLGVQNRDRKSVV